jgi:site-specific recombinase XerC
MNKRLLLISAALGAAVLSGVFLASAASASVGEFKSKLAEKLGVEQSQVESAMQGIKTERQTEIKAEQAENLKIAVDDGVITSEQKDALIAKQEEMRTKMRALQDEMQNWFKDQGIDQDALKGYQVGPGMGRGLGGMHKMMD